MNKQQIEAVVLEAYDRREKGASDEDSWVEFKELLPQSTWSRERWWKLARRIAALANSARGEAVFLVFENPATDLDHSELWSRLWSWFDEGVHPQEIATFEVPVKDGVRVLAAALETDRFPYVMQVHTGKDSEFKGHNFWEVPFRRNSKAESGRRHDLARLVLPLTRRPLVELRTWAVSFENSGRNQDPMLMATLTFQIVPSTQSPCYLLHEIQAHVSWNGHEGMDITLGHHRGNELIPESQVIPPPRQVVFRGRDRAKKPERATPIRVSATLRFEPGSIRIQKKGTLVWREDKNKWHLGREDSEPETFQFF